MLDKGIGKRSKPKSSIAANKLDIEYEYDIEKMANKCKTISNEILTSISERVTRIYI